MAYSQEDKQKLIDDICADIERGLSLRKSLINAGVSSQTFYSIIDEDEKKSKQYARACEARAEFIVDEMLEIADENNLDAYLDDEGELKIDGNMVARSKLKVDTRKWYVSKLNPKKYGDKIDIDHTTKGQPITKISIIDVDGSEI